MVSACLTMSQTAQKSASDFELSSSKVTASDSLKDISKQSLIHRLKSGILYGMKMGIISSVITCSLAIFQNYLEKLPLNPSSVDFPIYSLVFEIPFIEEIIFRYCFYEKAKNALEGIGIKTHELFGLEDKLIKNADLIASIFSSTIFGLIHLENNKNFPLLWSCYIGISSYYFYLGAYKKYGLVSSFACHATHNAFLRLVQ